MSDLIALLVGLVISIAFVEMLLGRPGLISGRAVSGAASAAPRIAGWLIILTTMFLVNTLLLLFRLLNHVSEPRRMPEDIAHYLERMVDAAMGKYR